MSVQHGKSLADFPSSQLGLFLSHLHSFLPIFALPSFRFGDSLDHLGDGPDHRNSLHAKMEELAEPLGSINELLEGLRRP
jgi:hypothetical protein